MALARTDPELYAKLCGGEENPEEQLQRSRAIDNWETFCRDCQDYWIRQGLDPPCAEGEGLCPYQMGERDPEEVRR